MEGQYQWPLPRTTAFFIWAINFKVFLLSFISIDEGKESQ